MIKFTQDGKVDRKWIDETPQHIAAAELADALDECVAALDGHHAEYCQQMRGPYGEQWREDGYPCTCWVGDTLRKIGAEQL